MEIKKELKKWSLGIKDWFSANKVILAVAIALVGLYIWFLFLENEELVNQAIVNENIKPWLIISGKAIISLLLYGLFIKVFLLSKPLLETIGEIFEKIFINNNFVQNLDHAQLIKLAKSIELEDSNIKFTDYEMKLKSIEAVVEKWRKGSKADNFIILESDYNHTIYASGHEIMYKKVEFKMMKSGTFKFVYKFRPFYADNLEEKLNNYKLNRPGDRWKDEAFSFICNDLEDSVNVRFEYIPANEDEKDWIAINFEHRSLIENTIFNIEFSISHPFGLGSELAELDRRKEYFDARYVTPHAIRKLTFQIETYNGSSDINLVPVLKKDDIGASRIRKESVYYKSWTWHLNYAEVEHNILHFTVE